MANPSICRMGKRWRRHVFPTALCAKWPIQTHRQSATRPPKPERTGIFGQKRKNGHLARHKRKLPAQISTFGQLMNSMNNHPNTNSTTCKTTHGEFENLSDNRAYRDILQALKNRLETWQKETNDTLRHPENLHRLTRKHDEIIEKYYAESAWGSSRDYEWDYTEYLYERYGKNTPDN